MRSMAATLLLLFSVAALAKEKPRITIRVINSEASQRQYTYTTSGRKGVSQTNCTTNGTANGTISDYGVGPIQSRSSGNANTNCTTTTSAATAPQSHIGYIPQEHVYAILPDGRHVILWCQQGYRRCDDLQPGTYEAEIDGNALFVFVHELSGKERKVKYRAVSLDEERNTAPTQSEPDASLPRQPNSAPPPPAQGINTTEAQTVTNDPEAQYRLGLGYESGKDLPLDCVSRRKGTP